ncbi:MAG: helix-turn-helix domain-containing protein [Oscillospiraceae bacterium]|jgi:transcriptional regulator with XRE-family HTH domain|nr:helix-turn-helix domain-containing protein [Oscillospiraceae bacterium]
MLYIAENLKKYRKQKNLTQEDVAELLLISPQSVSKWERGESYPDIAFLPALANLFETSIDALIGMDAIRAEETRYNIHKNANEQQRAGDYRAAAAIYRDALRTYPNDVGYMLGLADTLALSGDSEEAILLTERGLALSKNEKQRASSRAVLCFLYLKAGKTDKANALAATLPHTRESREVIQPLIAGGLAENEIDKNLRYVILGERE